MSIKKNAPRCNAERRHACPYWTDHVSLPPLQARFKHYCLITSRALYVPHTLHTRCANFNSPQLSHFTMPGTTNLKCVRRLFLRDLDVFPKGTAIVPTSLSESYEADYSCWGLNQSCSAARRGSTFSVLQPHDCSFRFAPHSGHSPWQSSLHRGAYGS